MSTLYWAGGYAVVMGLIMLMLAICKQLDSTKEMLIGLFFASLWPIFLTIGGYAFVRDVRLSYKNKQAGID